MPTTADASRPSLPSRLVRLLPGVAVATATAVTAWSLAAASGAVGLPRGDDWAYSRAAIGFAGTGQVRLAGWGLMTLVGQLVWAAPWIRLLGAHVWVLDLSTTALLTAGLVAAFALGRRVTGARDATVVVLGLALAPGLLRDATSFRTDIPALALGLVSLSAGVAGMQEPDPHSRARKRWACLLFGLWAFTVRQTALAAPAAVLLVDLVKRDTRRRGAVQAAALLAACAGFWWWRSTLPGSQRPDGRPPLFMVAELLVASFFTFALMMTPVLVWTAPRWLRPRHRRGRFAGAAAGAALACYPLLAARWSWTHRPMWLTGDYLDPRGVGADKLALGHRAALIPAPVWTLLTGVAVLSGITLCTLLAEAAATRSGHRSEPDPATRVLAAHLALTGLGLAVAAVADGNLYDRYLWPALVPAGVLLAARREAPAVWSPLGYQKAGLAVAAVLAAALAAESDAFDAALWRAGSTAVAAHYPAATVDAGFGWAGAHARGPVRADPPDVPSGRSWWSVMDGDHPVCVQVSASPLTTPGLHPLGSLRWDPLPVLGPERLYVYGTGDRACPDPAMLETLLNRS